MKRVILRILVIVLIMVSVFFETSKWIVNNRRSRILPM